MDFNIAEFINHLGQGTWLDSFTFYLSWSYILGAFWLLLAILALILDKKNGKWIFWGTIFAFVIYFILNDIIIKQSLASAYFRERPYIAHPNEIKTTGEMLADSSFPSGHMSITAALSMLYLYFYRKRWVMALAIIFTVIMAFDRIHNGMHYPSDVLVGIVVGIGYGYLTIFAIRKFKKRVSNPPIVETID